MLMNVGPLTISAAHFIHTCAPDSPCQRMHGHNYIVNVTVSGEPDECSCMLIDANVIKKVVDKYDHKTLVAKCCVKCDCEYNFISKSDKFLAVVNPTTKKAYVIPESDCHIIDIPSTSAEWLAKAIARDILNINNNVQYVEVTLSETPKLNVVARENSNRTRDVKSTSITCAKVSSSPVKVMPTADGVGRFVFGKLPMDDTVIDNIINKCFEVGCNGRQ